MKYELAYGDGRTAQELFAAGTYDNIWKEALAYIEGGRVEMNTAPGRREIVLIKLKFLYTDTGVFENIFRKEGLERPSAEDLLRFGAAYPDVQRECGTIAFMHRAWQEADGTPIRLCLGGMPVVRDKATGEITDPGVRSIRVTGGRGRRVWNNPCSFAARVPL